MRRKVKLVVASVAAPLVLAVAAVALEARRLGAFAPPETHELAVVALQWSRDGARLASADPTAVRIWDLGGALARRIGPRRPERTVSLGIPQAKAWGPVAISPDLDRAASYAEELTREGPRGWLVVTDLERGEHARYPVPVQLTRLAFSHDGKALACGDSSGGVSVLDPSMRVRWTSKGQEREVVALEFSPDDGVVYAADCDLRAELGDLRWFDAATGRARPRFTAFGRAFRALSVSPDGRAVALVDPMGAHLVEPATGEDRGIGKRREYEQEVDVVFAPDGRVLVTLAPVDEFGAPLVLIGNVGRLDEALPLPVTPSRAAISPDSRRAAIATTDAIHLVPLPPAR